MISSIGSGLAQKTIAIIGMGTAGTAAAVLFAKQGHHVKIFDKYSGDDFGDIRGAGIGLQPIGLSVLKHLGVLNSVLDCGARIERLHSLNYKGRTILDLFYADFRPELYGLGISRGVLATELCSLMHGFDNIEVLTGRSATNVIYQPSQLSPKPMPYIEFFGEKSIDSEENKVLEGPFDMVVICDGRSSIRKNLKGVKSYEKAYPFGCLWTVLPDYGDRFTNTRTLSQTLDSAKVMLGVLPTGKVIMKNEKTDKKNSTMDKSMIESKYRKNGHNHVTLFWSIELDRLNILKASK